MCLLFKGAFDAICVEKITVEFRFKCRKSKAKAEVKPLKESRKSKWSLISIHRRLVSSVYTRKKTTKHKLVMCLFTFSFFASTKIKSIPLKIPFEPTNRTVIGTSNIVLYSITWYMATESSCLIAKSRSQDFKILLQIPSQVL